MSVAGAPQVRMDLSAASQGFRMPAEWEPHRATWLAWPHAPTTWPGHLAQAQVEYAGIVRRIRERFPDAVVFETICDSTEKRQTEIKALAAGTDAVFIVGGRNSANTRRLAELARLSGKPALMNSPFR